MNVSSEDTVWVSHKGRYPVSEVHRGLCNWPLATVRCVGAQVQLQQVLSVEVLAMQQMTAARPASVPL